MTTLTYKTQTEVSAIVRRFWGLYFGSMGVWFMLVIGLGYTVLSGGNAIGQSFGVVPLALLALLTIVVASLGAQTFLVVCEKKWNVRRKQVSDFQCEELADWMNSYPEVQQHIETIRHNRTVVEYDYVQIEKWVSAKKRGRASLSRAVAYQHVHGIA